ncbi:MAG: sigma 54-interacting transcriptional regulator [Cyclonatronaceae bacterium]
MLHENIISHKNREPEFESSFQTKSPLMRDIFQKVKSIAQLEKHLILIGEIGVGKKNMAHAIHRNSSRATGPFHSFYCINTNEDEFKEAFWEQVYVENDHLLLKYDVLEKASNGILYLNKFSEMSAAFMLNIIDSYIHGCNQLFRYNQTLSPRLIISISQDSFQEFMKTDVWKKILALLNPVSIMIPPLRERREDIPAFIQKFIEEARISESAWHRLDIADGAMQECLAYRWPGNMRQLKNAIYQGALLSQGNLIECNHLPFSINWQLPYQDY